MGHSGIGFPFEENVATTETGSAAASRGRWVLLVLSVVSLVGGCVATLLPNEAYAILGIVVGMAGLYASFRLQQDAEPKVQDASGFGRPDLVANKVVYFAVFVDSKRREFDFDFEFYDEYNGPSDCIRFAIGFYGRMLLEMSGPHLPVRRELVRQMDRILSLPRTRVLFENPDPAMGIVFERLLVQTIPARSHCDQYGGVMVKLDDPDRRIDRMVETITPWRWMKGDHPVSQEDWIAASLAVTFMALRTAIGVNPETREDDAFVAWQMLNRFQETVHQSIETLDLQTVVEAQNLGYLGALVNLMVLQALEMRCQPMETDTKPDA